MKRLVWIVMATGLAQVAYAQEDANEDRGPYVGLSLGSFNYDRDFHPFQIHVDDTTPAYRIFGGYRFSEHFALEGAWGETGDIEDSVTVPTSQGDLRIDVKGEYEVLTIRALGIMPLGEKVSLYGGLGYYNATVTTHLRAGVGTYDYEDRENGATFVGGVEFKLKRMNIRAEIEKPEVDGGARTWDVNVGTLFRF
jgi:hypothetical protein